jgi:hypothetical protein
VIKDVACWNEPNQQPVTQLVILKNATGTIRECLEFYDNGTQAKIRVDEGYNYGEFHKLLVIFKIIHKTLTFL